MNDSRLSARSLVFAFALFCSSQPCFSADLPQANHFSITAGPVLESPTETSIRVTWITERNATGTVEYGPAEDELQTAYSSRHGLIDANQRLHSILLEGLRPGTLYCYRVVSREILNFAAYKVDFGEAVTNELHHFRTLDRRLQKFSFLVFNDIHDQAATIPELLRVAGPQPYDFIVFNGDTVSHTDDEKPVVSILSQAASSFASSIPMVWVRGNHEARGRFARQLPDYMGLPNERYYYSFDHGMVHFIVLDAGEDKMDGSPEYSGLVDFSRYRREQGEWLKAHVRESSFKRAKFRVVICHMPFPRDMGSRHARPGEKNVFLGMPDAYEQFGHTLEKAGIDLMLSGHVHSAAVIPPEPPRHSYPIIQGGGNKGDARTLIRVNVTRQGLEAILLGPDGTQVNWCKVGPRSGGLFRTR
jgi:acid phosphatase type 7